MTLSNFASIITINGRDIGRCCPPYIIAELSANHNGSIETAKQTILAAKENGADAIKLQTYTADTMTIDCNNDEFMIKGGLWDGYKLYDLYDWAHTPYEWHQELFEYAAQIGITIFSTPFDKTAVDLLESLNTPAYKIASFEITDLPLIQYIAKTGKPIIMSTGMANEQEISEAIQVITDAGGNELIVLHCISSYPAPLEEANLLTMTDIINKYQVVGGLSDHTLTNITSVTAVALGASVIEKHFMLSNENDGADSQFSILPVQLADLCRDAKQAWLSLGRVNYELNEGEKENVKYRRSLYFIADIKAGETISAQHVKNIRPGLGLSPNNLSNIIGKQVIRDVSFGTPVSWDCIVVKDI